MKKIVIIIGIVIISCLIGGGVYYFFRNIPEAQIIHPPCLEDNEVATFEFHGNRTTATSADVVINNKISGKEVFHFQIDGLVPHYYSYELFSCSIYTIRQFNFNVQTRRATPYYRIELWRYDYSGSGEKVLLFSETNGQGNYISYFNDDFRIDPSETYVVLERSYLGNPNYALVVKDLETKEDVFVLTFDNIKKINPEVQLGSFNLGKFTEDGRYLWGTLFIGALDTAYYRIELGTWKTEIFVPPPDIPSGAERSTSFAGYIAYADITSFTGIKEVTEQIEEEARKKDKMKNLWIYNFFTKEKIKIASADPAWRFDIQWISDTELEYFMPSGEKKIYNIENR